MTASGSPIVKVDLVASNGVVHIIDRVIYPIPTGSDMAKYLELEPNYSSLYAALEVHLNAVRFPIYLILETLHFWICDQRAQMGIKFLT